MPEETIEIELLWWRGCPSTEEAIELVREEMDAAGIDPAALRITEVETDEQAAALGFPGSPTIRVEGRDLVPADDQPVGLTCRVYRLRDGRISPLPDRADLRAALRDAIANRDSKRREGG